MSGSVIICFGKFLLSLGTFNLERMDIHTEKAAVVHQLEQVEDLELVLAIKHLLDYGLKRQETDPAFVAALGRALKQSNQGEGRSHEVVKEDFRHRYPV